MLARTLELLVLIIFATPVAAQGVSGLRDANNTLIGEYSEFRNGTVVHSVRGYRFLVNGTSGAVGRVDVDVGGANYDAVLLYATFDCTGTAYIGVSVQGALAGGVVMSAGSRGLFAVAKNATSSVVLLGSSWNGSDCAPIAPGAFVAVPAAPNDPAVTGVPNGAFVPPIRLEIVPISQFFELFKDGFESSLRALGRRVDAYA